MILAFILVAALPAPELTLAASVERVPGLSCEAQLDVRPLERSVAVKCPGGAAQLAKAKTELCPTVSREGDKVTFHCSTPRIAAVQSKGALLLFRLRGLPTRGEDGPPPSPPSAELDRWCGPSASALRAGDAALAGGDPSAALAQYRDVGHEGPCGRLATERICEIEGGACLSKPGVWDASGFKDGFLRDLLLRQARANAMDGHPMEAIAPLARLGRQACAESALCRHLLAVVLREKPSERTGTALALAISLPAKGPFALELARAEAETSFTLGAPKMGASILAAATPLVPPSDSDEHLLRVVEMYATAHDRAHVDAVTEFAKTRMPPATFASPRWRAVTDEASAAVKAPTPPRQELEAARSALASAAKVPAR